MLTCPPSADLLPAEVAAELRISVATLRRRPIPFYREGKQRRYQRAALDEYKQARTLNARRPDRALAPLESFSDIAANRNQ